MRAAGVEFVTDTCVVVTPILPDPPGVLMTDSGKFAHYTPGNTGYGVRYGSAAECVDTAVHGHAIRDEIPMAVDHHAQPLPVSEVLLAGEAHGGLLRLDQPISFWGGVDPRSGCICDPRHPQFGFSVAGRILAMERVVGSCSGSSIMMELMAIGKAPAGLILTEADAILTLGVITGREMGYGSIPVFLVSNETLRLLPSVLRMSADGSINPAL